jgi:hypothetical protein
MRALRIVAWAVLLASTARAPALAGGEGALAWVHVEANTGGSSGGHVALRVGDTIYHVQQTFDGLYELNRDEWETFQHLYSGLQNRRLAVAQLDVAAVDVERVEERLAKAFVVQRAEFARRSQLALDVAWTLAWREGRPPPPLAAAGLLAPSPQPDAHAQALRESVRKVYGPDHLVRERQRVEEILRAFGTDARDLEALREALLLREALVGLEEGFALAEGALLPLEGLLAEPLADDERQGARRFAEAQEQAVLELIASRRPDRARPLLLAMARYQALARSAASGRLVLLDAYAGFEELPPAREHTSQTAAAKLAAELAPLLHEGRAKVLAGAAVDEVRYNLLEVGAGVLREFARGALGAPVRKLPRRATPAAARVVTVTPPVDEAWVAQAHVEALRALARQEERLRARYFYGVVRSNCVTELVRLQNEAFPPGDAERALGAELAPGRGLGFIPFAFFHEATRRLRVAHRDEVLSHRQRELARLARDEAGALLRLREAITLTSDIYTPRLRDGRFLFFTDDVVWLRPLLGVANLGFASGHGLVGLLSAPLDGGDRLRAAASGFGYSLPELFFANIRKGTFEYVAPEP